MPAEFADTAAYALTVVGVGADGWQGLSTQARHAIHDADVLLGGHRHLALIGATKATKHPWPSPLLPGLDELLRRHSQARICVLASGDPLVSGIASTLIRRYGSAAVRIIPTVSSVTLARARLGWPAEETEVISTVGRNINKLRGVLAPGRRLLVLSADEHTPRSVAELLVDAGYSTSAMTVLEELGGSGEREHTATAREFGNPEIARLNLLAVECVADGPAACLSIVPGLPDEAFEHDGQLTKRGVRAITLATLAPLPGQLLWDVGAGCGSVGIEWCRAHPSNRAIAVERDPERRARIERNAQRLGAIQLQVCAGPAPDAFAELETPDAVFVGGGVTASGVLAGCWDALRDGGVLAANGVTMEAEQRLGAARTTWGGQLSRLAVEHAEPLGGFTGWTPARTVTQWHARKPQELS